MCTCVCLWCTTDIQVPSEARVYWMPGAGLTGCCEAPAKVAFLTTGPSLLLFSIFFSEIGSNYVALNSPSKSFCINPMSGQNTGVHCH